MGEAPQQPIRSSGRQQQMSTSMWDSKPAWCQPWTILLTGAGIIWGAHLLSHGSLLWTALAAGPITLWWYAFLVAVPAEYRQYREAQLEAMQDDRADP